MSSADELFEPAVPEVYEVQTQAPGPRRESAFD